MRNVWRSIVAIALIGSWITAHAVTTHSGAYEIINPGDSNSSVGDRVDATTILHRNDDGAAMTFNVRGLAKKAPYTTWWVVFNAPENCESPCACNFPDVFDPDKAAAAQTSVFWASGRVSDRWGQAVFSSSINFGELPDGDDQVLFGDGLVSPGAEIHLVTRGHGKRRGWRKLEAQLTEFNGACSPDCFDEHVSVHRSPSCTIN